MDETLDNGTLNMPATESTWEAYEAGRIREFDASRGSRIHGAIIDVIEAVYLKHQSLSMNAPDQETAEQERQRALGVKGLLDRLNGEFAQLDEVRQSLRQSRVQGSEIARSAAFRDQEYRRSFMDEMARTGRPDLRPGR